MGIRHPEPVEGVAAHLGEASVTPGTASVTPKWVSVTLSFEGVMAHLGEASVTPGTASVTPKWVSVTLSLSKGGERVLHFPVALTVDAVLTPC